MDKSPEDQKSPKSRPTSRRSSVSSPRRNSIKKDKDRKQPQSAHSTPKKAVKTTPDFMVQGKPLLKKSDRANSLPGSYRRPSSAETLTLSPRVKKVAVNVSKASASKSHGNSVEDDMTLDLSQVSDFEDTNSKYGVKTKFNALATSTPKPKFKPRSASVQSHLHLQKKVERRGQSSLEEKSRESTFSYSRDSLYKTSSSASPHRYGECDYSSVSPEYSGQSSTDVSPRIVPASSVVLTPHSTHASSCNVSSWQDSDVDTKVEDRDAEGEWSHFWANYNNSLAKVPMKNYYDQCPTPYRTESIELRDFDVSAEGSRLRSPHNIQNINTIIRNEGLHLTPRETQNMIKCAHILGNVLSKAIERRAREKDTCVLRDKDSCILTETLVEGQEVFLNERLGSQDKNLVVLKNSEAEEIQETQGKSPANLDKDAIISQETSILNETQDRSQNDSVHKEILAEVDAILNQEKKEAELLKKALTLNLKETAIPLNMQEEKRQETVQTQTDISLPNTKSAPRIFESILRQLSRSSIDVKGVKEKVKEEDKETKEQEKVAKEQEKEAKEQDKVAKEQEKVAKEQDEVAKEQENEAKKTDQEAKQPGKEVKGIEKETKNNVTEG